MTFQANMIQQAIKSQLSRRQIYLDDESILDELIVKNIRCLNPGDYVAVEIDGIDRIEAVKKVVGFACLNTISEKAIIISYHELERHFHEQQYASIEF